MRILSSKLVIFALLTAIGSVVAVREIQALAEAPVAATPLNVAINHRDVDPANDLAGYVALARYHLVENRLKGRDDTPLKFISYMLAVTRATAQTCEALGADVHEATTLFSQEHADLYGQAAEQLAADGLNSERIWALLRPTIENIATSKLDHLARRLGGDRNDACRWVAEHPTEYADARRYSAHYPRLFKLLAER